MRFSFNFAQRSYIFKIVHEKITYYILHTEITIQAFIVNLSNSFIIVTGECGSIMTEFFVSQKSCRNNNVQFFRSSSLNLLIDI